MDLALSEEQEMLKRMARAFLTDKFPKEVVRQMEESELGYSPDIWKEMAELGWMGLVFPEKYGGTGMSFLDLAVLLEEMGRACVPGPYFSTVILGGLPVLDVGNEEQKQEYLPKIANGEAMLTLALIEPSAKYDAASITVRAIHNGDNYVISGTKSFVPDAHIADYILFVARTSEGAKPEDGITTFIVDARSPGIRYSVLKTIAGDKLFELVFDQVEVPKENVLGQLGQGWNEVQTIIRRSALAKCCEMVGGAQKVFEMTVDYAKERKQFDRPIGSFQIIQHYCADMVSDVDALRLVTYQAAWMMSKGMPCAKEVAMAKAWAGETYRRVTAVSHQIHGAIGFTMDHDLPFYSRRAKAAEVAFGDHAFYQSIVAQKIGL
jgi:alkylation response protein AidB-like acyl-CoA dehydrogenase